MFYLIMFTTLVFVLVYSLIEKKKNDQNIARIPIRINVNGIRGKSTITRLITSLLSEAGFNTIGKTTGTSSRLIENQDVNELEIKRGQKGVSIAEQLDVIEWAAQKEAEALVCECMAVNPEYQKVYQEQMIKANYGVIVNVLEDHMDVLGPSLDEVALAFTHTIPYQGNLIVQDNEYTDYFKKIAKERGTKVWVANERNIPEGYLNRFDHVLFPNNVAIALAVAESLGISQSVALAGMLKMNPDPGTLKYHYINKPSCTYLFINGFAINDPQSVMEVLPRVRQDYSDKHNKDLYLLFNARKDRIDRSKQFIADVFSRLDFPFHLIVVGEMTKDFNDSVKNNKFNNLQTYHNYESVATEILIKDIETYCDGAIIFGIGNIHGEGYEYLNYIYTVEEDYSGGK